MSTRVEQYRSAILTTANQLTILRIVFVPVFISLLAYGEIGWALGTFVAAGVTDVLDGIIARRFGQKTSIGAVLDPLADKLLMTASLLILSLPQMEFHNTIPRWLMILVIFRDVFILLVSLIIVLMVGWRVFTPSPYGKASTFLQVVTVLAVLYSNWKHVAVPELNIIFYMTGVMTAFSGLHYLVRSLRQWHLNE
ncbi:MAG: CDP-diacylglycerol--glycerol-3-phosphate 3-phosphatidyltransferase [Acidobacteria bacterium]|nr:MAG: CDP-diacylglycerol--glycerol-3-phosphate 3-phosphatidyltransferase [Acidobacteriota bacterium]